MLKLRVKRDGFIELHLNGEASHIECPGGQYRTISEAELVALRDMFNEAIDFLKCEPNYKVWEVKD